MNLLIHVCTVRRSLGCSHTTLMSIHESRTSWIGCWSHQPVIRHLSSIFIQHPVHLISFFNHSLCPAQGLGGVLAGGGQRDGAAAHLHRVPRRRPALAPGVLRTNRIQIVHERFHVFALWRVTACCIPMLHRVPWRRAALAPGALQTPSPTARQSRKCPVDGTTYCNVVLQYPPSPERRLGRPCSNIRLRFSGGDVRTQPGLTCVLHRLQPHPRPVMSAMELGAQIVRADPATEAVEADHLW